MARRIARKSNKTSHVLNLLTDPKSSEPAPKSPSAPESPNEISSPAEPALVEDTASSELIEPTDSAPDTAPESAPTKPRRRSSHKPAISDSPVVQTPVDTSQALEERISQQIQASLSAQLAEDEEKEAQRAEQDRKIAERIAAEMGMATDMKQPSTEEEAAAPAEEPAPTKPSPSTPEPNYDFELVNVMEAILDQFQMEFMERFQMCTCHRCWLDTRALTLSSLNGKYVVLERDSIGPMLNFYDHRYRGMIMAQLTQACMAVMANPHH